MRPKVKGALGAYVLGLVELVKWLAPSVVSALVVYWAVNAVAKKP